MSYLSPIFSIAAQAIQFNEAKLNNLTQLWALEGTRYHTKQDIPNISTIRLNDVSFTSALNSTKLAFKVTHEAMPSQYIHKRFIPQHPNANKDGSIYEITLDPIDKALSLSTIKKNYLTELQLLKIGQQLFSQTLKIGEVP
jgi:flagellar basal body rod protein FlgC